jgi:hypothetical protein
MDLAGTKAALLSERHRWEAHMERRIKAVSSMPFADGFGITAVLDDDGRWHFGGLFRGLISITIEIRAEDRERCFDNAEAVAAYFQHHYAEKLAGETERQGG